MDGPLLLFILGAVLSQTGCLGALVDLGTPSHLQQCLDGYNQTGSQSEDGASYFFNCFEIQLIRTSDTRWPGWNVSLLHPWVKSLFQKTLVEISGNRARRVRQEYRTLSRKDRDCFHRALNIMKNDTSVFPNKFDTLAAFHSDPLIAVAAHGGPSFFIWHRIHLLMYEIALRELVPDVVVPYWDFTIDSALPDPRESSLWTSELLGNGIGPVVTGPFANWLSQAGPLIRNIGNRGKLPSKEEVDNILSKNTLAEIGFPDTTPSKNLEYMHGNAHEWVGGQHSILDTSPFDPVYLLLHGYIDYLWFKIQEKQRKLGISPSDDYPKNYGDSLYAPNSTVGIAPVTNKRALEISVLLTERVYCYKDSPTCSLADSQCGSPHLVCRSNRCVAERSTGLKLSSVPTPYQNNFCINTQCDTGLLAYVPIQVIYKRPARGRSYKSCPVKNGEVVKTLDIYNRRLYSGAGGGVGAGESCLEATEEGGVGVVGIQSTGFNYGGAYKEDAIVNQRLDVSSSIAYVGIKNPASGPADVFLFAFSPEGKVCQPSCLVCEPHRRPFYRPCYGHVRFTEENPKFHGGNVADAYDLVWRRKGPGRLVPTFRQESIPLIFHCDDEGPLPASSSPYKKYRSV